MPVRDTIQELAPSLVPTAEGPCERRELLGTEEVYVVGASSPFAARALGRLQQRCATEVLVGLGTRSLRCSPDQQVWTVRDGAIGTTPARALAPGTIVVCAESYYPTDGSWTPDLARLVGAFLGDGWVRQRDVRMRGYTLGLAIGSVGEAHTTRYRDLAATVLPNTGWGAGWRVGTAGHFGISCSSKSAWTLAHELGLGARSAQRRVPRAAFAASREAKLALLAGYVDADGSVAGPSTTNHGRATFASVSPWLSTGLRELAIACGLHVTPVRLERRRTNYGDVVIARFVMAADSVMELPLWHTAKAANRRTTGRRTAHLSAQYLAGARLAPGTFARRVRTVEPIAASASAFLPKVTARCGGIVVDGVVLGLS